jgi:hypothetical protein
MMTRDKDEEEIAASAAQYGGVEEKEEERRRPWWQERWLFRKRFGNTERADALAMPSDSWGGTAMMTVTWVGGVGEGYNDDNDTRNGRRMINIWTFQSSWHQRTRPDMAEDVLLQASGTKWLVEREEWGICHCCCYSWCGCERVGVRGVGGVGVRRMRGGGARFEEEDGCEIIIKFL